MYKKRGVGVKNQSKSNLLGQDERFMPKLEKLMATLSESSRNKLQLMLEDFQVRRKDKMEEYEAAEKREDARLRTASRQLMFQIPANVQVLKIGDILNAGGLFDVKNCSPYFAIPASLMHTTQTACCFAMPSFTGSLKKTRTNSRQVLGELHNSTIKSVKKTAKRSSNLLSPVLNSSKKKVAKLASKPSHQYSMHHHSLHNTAKRITRSTAMKPDTSRSIVSQSISKAADELMDTTDGIDTLRRKIGTPKPALPSKPARVPDETEEVVVYSKNGTPLIVDSQWLKKRFNLEK